MGLMAMAGFLLVKTGKLDAGVTIGISNILIYIVLPCIIVNSMQREFDPGEGRLLLAALLMSLISYGVFILFAQLTLRRSGNGDANVGLERFVYVLPNTGYIGIPLVDAVLGEDGVFFLTAYIVLFNLIMFSYGRYQLSKDGESRGFCKAARPFSKESVARSLINPATMGLLIGGFFYLTGIRLPYVPMTLVQGFTGLNSVLSMVLIGVFLAQTDLRSLFRFPRGIMISLVRLVVLPLIVIILLKIIDFTWLVQDDRLVKTTIIIASCTPASVASSFMSELCGADHLYGAKLVVASTVLSIATMPAVLMLWEWVSSL